MVSPMAERVACSRVMGGWRRWLPNWNTTTSISSRISTEEADQNGQKTSEMHCIVILTYHFSQEKMDFSVFFPINFLSPQQGENNPLKTDMTRAGS